MLHRLVEDLLDGLRMRCKFCYAIRLSYDVEREDEVTVRAGPVRVDVEGVYGQHDARLTGLASDAADKGPALGRVGAAAALAVQVEVAHDPPAPLVRSQYGREVLHRDLIPLLDVLNQRGRNASVSIALSSDSSPHLQLTSPTEPMADNQDCSRTNNVTQTVNYELIRTKY